MAIHTRSKTVLTILTVLVTGVPGFAAAEPTSRLLTGGECTKRIEGPAVDAAGALYAMNLGSDGVIGKLSPGATTSVPFATLPNGGIGSGARFDRAGRLYVADFKNHKVHVFEPGQTMRGVYFEAREDDPHGKFNQPNDLAMAADGTIYASDPKLSDGTGPIWRIARGADGKVRGEVLTFGNQPMGVTNSIELSPDEATLYVGESQTSSKPARLLAYRSQDGKLVERRVLKTFDQFDLDGMRTDIDGKLFAARPDAGTVAVFAPDGTPLPEIRLLKKGPTNLAFGGPGGTTVFVTQSEGEHGFIEAFGVDRPGREFCMLRPPGSC
jgi:signal peptidase